MYLDWNANPPQCWAYLHFSFLQVAQNREIQIFLYIYLKKQSNLCALLMRPGLGVLNLDTVSLSPSGTSTEPLGMEEDSSREEMRRKTKKRGWRISDVSVTNCHEEMEKHFCFREVNFDKGEKQVKKSDGCHLVDQTLIRECEGVLWIKTDSCEL